MAIQIDTDIEPITKQGEERRTLVNNLAGVVGLITSTASAQMNGIKQVDLAFELLPRGNVKRVDGSVILITRNSVLDTSNEVITAGAREALLTSIKKHFIAPNQKDILSVHYVVCKFVQSEGIPMNRATAFTIGGFDSEAEAYGLLYTEGQNNPSYEM